MSLLRTLWLVLCVSSLVDRLEVCAQPASMVRVDCSSSVACSVACCGLFPRDQFAITSIDCSVCLLILWGIICATRPMAHSLLEYFAGCARSYNHKDSENTFRRPGRESTCHNLKESGLIEHGCVCVVCLSGAHFSCSGQVQCQGKLDSES